MQVFYAPDIDGSKYVLDQNESKHIVRVMRMSSGTPVKLVDGKGNLYEGIIDDPDPKECSIKITGIVNNFETRNYRLHIAISPLKNTDRLEWFIEKSVEIGIDEITPLICRNTEKPNIKKERLVNIIVSAMKQSLKSTLTKINDPVEFKDFLEKGHDGTGMIAHCNEDYMRRKIADAYHPGKNALIMIGPEGDFSNEEIKAAMAKGFEGIHLGKSRLRTETAGVAACHSIYLLNQ
ncbi:MAG: 16S rRNA (uracil(1498)-N(3))-methyltransferase [Methanosarcina sp.]